MLSIEGRLILEPDPDTWISENLSSPVSLEPISPDIAQASCSLPNFLGDPADRMIVATAVTLGLPLITTDSKIIAWNQEHRLLQVIEL